MNLQTYKTLLLVVTAILALLVASPALQRLLVLPRTDFFTEMWLLDSEHKAENFPFNITSNSNYSIFLGIGNQLGSCAYYSIQVKFRNQTQPDADIVNRIPSSLPPLYSINAFVADKESLEVPIAFSFDYTYDENLSQVTFSRMNFNNFVLNLNEYSATWNPQKNGFFGFLFFELWIYNEALSDFEYHERLVSLRLNMTTESLI